MRALCQSGGKLDGCIAAFNGRNYDPDVDQLLLHFSGCHVTWRNPANKLFATLSRASMVVFALALSIRLNVSPMPKALRPQL